MTIDWYRCPHCGKKLFPLEATTRAVNLPYKCKACRQAFKINIESQEPLRQEPVRQ